MTIQTTAPRSIYQAGDAPSRQCLAACLITDAERYTGLSEAMEPNAVVHMINRYFDSLFGPVIENGGMISDVKGDGLLALWNHASAGQDLKARACKASLEILQCVDELNATYPSQRLPTRLGLDFGPVAIAPIGARERYEHRAVGDPVNTANRLQELNKILKTRILVSETFADGLGGFVFRDLGNFHLRGKRSRTRVLELIGKRGQSGGRAEELCAGFAYALEAYRQGNERAAERRFRILQTRFPDDGPTRYYLQRIASVRIQFDEAIERDSPPPPKAGWSGALWPAVSVWRNWSNR